MTAERQWIRKRMGQGFPEAAREWQGMRQGIGWLKERGLERFYRDRAPAIFGHLLSQGYDATSQVADRLHEARQAGQLSDQEYEDVLAADLLWGSRMRDSRQPIVVVLEASWTVETADVERAARRASVLRRIGLHALPVAAGQEWPLILQAEAREARVALVRDRLMDQTSWETALANL